ncbi:MAG: hypothetical protein JWN38_196 [Candidatus Saccharibacteria bacterium]|nr:hypothetical protein [Candidatus Saccharibacteria bacterium]
MAGTFRLPTRKPKGVIGTIIFVLAIALWVAQQAGWLDGAKQAVVTNDPGLYSIDHFVDGDTIAVNMNGSVQTVRFIGIDTPETHKPNTPVQCYGPAAAAETKTLIGTNKVRLETDPQSTNKDRYDRLLRYIYLPDGTLLNAKLVEGGYAFYYPYFPFTKSKQFSDLQTAAQAANKGLWGNCHPIKKDKGGYESNVAG